MAQRRLLDRKITTSERVNKLGGIGALIYTWTIPIADDFGVLQGSAWTIKTQVFPGLEEVTVEYIEKVIAKMLECSLWQQFDYEERRYFFIKDFSRNQNLREDMQPYTILPFKLSKDYAENWKKIKDEIKQSLVRFRTSSSDFGTEVKIREDTIQLRNNDAKPNKNSNEFSDWKKKLKLPEKKTNGIGHEFQNRALEIIEKLGITVKRQSAYFKIIKEEPRHHIEAAYSFAVDHPTPEARDKMFFWKLADLNRKISPIDSA